MTKSDSHDLPLLDWTAMSEGGEWKEREHLPRKICGSRGVMSCGSARPMASENRNAERQRRYRERLRSKAPLVRSVEVPHGLVEYMIVRGFTTEDEMREHPERFAEAITDLLELVAENRLVA